MKTTDGDSPVRGAIVHLTHHDEHVMHAAIVGKGDRGRVDRETVQFGPDDPLTSALWIDDGDLIPSAEKPPDDLVPRPR